MKVYVLRVSDINGDEVVAASTNEADCLTHINDNPAEGLTYYVLEEWLAGKYLTETTYHPGGVTVTR